ncbi:MAG: cytochrome c-type biogenesis protein CcmH [Burkholderiales bacterium]|nr:cytochrome c-type biogenesis protein CcmH [Burkholderiales bacterium]
MTGFRALHRLVLLALLVAAAQLVAPSRALALTVAEVAQDLACPCECPLILQDCNMSCGLGWKREIGERIAQGWSKQQIVDDFIARYGNDARLTPLQKVNGKIYQYTRGFDTLDWVLLWAGLATWILAMSLAVYLGARRLFPDKLRDA